VRVEEPGVDLAIALAVASAARGVPLLAARESEGEVCCCFGELGLTGELRWVGHPERRLAEAARHGISGVIAPAGSGEGAGSPGCRPAGTLREALGAALPSSRTGPASLAA
jgi:DNA repair protein RadA/Sms